MLKLFLIYKMKLIKLILTSIVIVAYVLGEVCQDPQKITGYKLTKLKRLSDYVEKYEQLKEVENGTLDDILFGILRFTLGDEPHTKSYLKYKVEYIEEELETHAKEHLTRAPSGKQEGELEGELVPHAKDQQTLTPVEKLDGKSHAKAEQGLIPVENLVSIPKPIRLRLVFLVFDKEYEMVQMSVELLNGCTTKMFEARLSDQYDCVYLKGDKNGKDDLVSLRLKGKTVNEDFSFIYSLNHFKFFQDIKAAKEHGNPKITAPQTVIKEKPEDKKMESSIYSSYISSNRLYTNAFESQNAKTETTTKTANKTTTNEDEKIIEVFHYDNSLAIKLPSVTKTYPLNKDHCALSFIRYVKMLMSALLQNKNNQMVLTFYSTVNGEEASNNDINPSKQIDSFQYGILGYITHKSVIELINGVKKEVPYIYALFDKEVSGFGTKLILRLEDKKQKTIKIYYFNFPDEQSIEKIKYEFYKNVPCTNDLLFSWGLVFKSDQANDKKFLQKNNNLFQIKLNEASKNIEVSRLTKPGSIDVEETDPIKKTTDPTQRTSHDSIPSNFNVSVKTTSIKDVQGNVVIFVFRGMSDRVSQDTHVRTYESTYSVISYKTYDKCIALTKKFADKIKELDDSESNFYQIEFVKLDDDLNEYYESSENARLITGNIKFDNNGQMVLMFDQTLKQIEDENISAKDKEIAFYQYEYNILTNSKFEAPLVFVYLKGVDASIIVELTYNKKKLRLWFFKTVKSSPLLTMAKTNLKKRFYLLILRAKDIINPLL
jgi:hypothetical protein